MATLNLDKCFELFLLLILFQFCEPNQNKLYNKYSEVSKKIVGQIEYSNIYKKAVDSINIWILNKIDNYKFHQNGKNFILDSLLCFNKDGTKFIAGLININIKNPNSDGINFFYGEKIKNNWFFFRGGYTVIPREMVKGQNIHIPLNYEQLHQIGLKEIYSPYLNLKGEINEAWFKNEFEGFGWGKFEEQGPENDWYLKGRRFKTKKEFFQSGHLDKVKNNWLQRDTTQPIKQLPNKDEKLP